MLLNNCVNTFLEVRSGRRWRAFALLLPYWAFLWSTLAWAYADTPLATPRTPTPLAEGDAWGGGAAAQQTAVWALTLGFAYVNSRLCIAHLTRQRLAVLMPILIPFLTGALNAHLGLGVSSLLLWRGALLWVVCVYATWIPAVIRDMLKVKGVYLFRIPYDEQGAKEK